MALGELVVIAFAVLWSLMPLVTLVLAIRINRKLDRILEAIGRD